MQKHYKFARLPVLILALSAFLVSSRSAFAARYVLFEVSIDGKTVLTTSTWDNGSQDADHVWQNLEKLQLRPISAQDNSRHSHPLVREYQVEPDRDEPLHATLKGRVIIDCTYGGRALVRELKLVRENADSPWKLAPADLERTFKSRHQPFSFGISLDGQQVLYTQQATTTGEHAEDTDSAWLQLKHQDFLPINAAKEKGSEYQVEADGDDSTRGTLHGNIIVSLSYGGRTSGQVKVSQLKFVRSKAAAWKWTFDPAEVERILARRKKSDDREPG